MQCLCNHRILGYQKKGFVKSEYKKISYKNTSLNYKLDPQQWSESSLMWNHFHQKRSKISFIYKTLSSHSAAKTFSKILAMDKIQHIISLNFTLPYYSIATITTSKVSAVTVFSMLDRRVKCHAISRNVTSKSAQSVQLPS